MTFEELKKVNEKLPQIDFKGKGYVEVNKRVIAFRELFPMGIIDSQLLSMADGVCVVQAKAYDEQGNLLSTGLAYEKESSSYINKTSYVENCETSAVGRCLGFLGIGVDTSIASYDEVDNAVRQQEEIKKPKEPDVAKMLFDAKTELATNSDKTKIKSLCAKLKVGQLVVLQKVGITKEMIEQGHKMTKEEYGKALVVLKEIEDKLGEQ